MSVKHASVHAKWIIGKVIGTKMLKTAKVRVTRMVLDPYLLKVKSSLSTSTSTVVENKTIYANRREVCFSAHFQNVFRRKVLNVSMNYFSEQVFDRCWRLWKKNCNNVIICKLNTCNVLLSKLCSFNNIIYWPLVQYYNKRKTYFAHDALQQCTVGDVVLLKALPEPRSKHVKHELAEIVYKVGQVVDPLTGKRVAGTEFVEPLTDVPLGSEEDASCLSEKLQELNISSGTGSSRLDGPAAQNPSS